MSQRKEYHRNYYLAKKAEEAKQAAEQEAAEAKRKADNKERKRKSREKQKQRKQEAELNTSIMSQNDENEEPPAPVETPANFEYPGSVAEDPEMAMLTYLIQNHSAAKARREKSKEEIDQVTREGAEKIDKYAREGAAEIAKVTRESIAEAGKMTLARVSSIRKFNEEQDADDAGIASAVKIAL